jgi:hypothetical protein
MDEDPYGIEVTIRGEIENGYRLKVSFHHLGMYIDGFRAIKVPKDKNPLEWWIQQPSYRVGFQYKPSPEFNKKHPFWSTIESRCIEAVSEEVALNIGNLSNEAFTKEMETAFEEVNDTHKYPH